jgi:hypothetical protein
LERAKERWLGGSPHTLFCDPVRAVHLAACGLMSVQRKTFLKKRVCVCVITRFFVAWKREGGVRVRTCIGRADDLAQES